MKEINARGLVCPQPVIAVKNALSEMNDGIIKITVDNFAAKENVTRFAHSQKCEVEVVDGQVENEFEIKIIKGEPQQEAPEKKSNNRISNKTIYIADDKVGTDEELGQILLKGFIHTIKEADELPQNIIFVNRGIFVTCKWEDSIEDLQELIELGVTIYSCGTCLSYYELIDELKVGIIGSALDTVNCLMISDSVIKY